MAQERADLTRGKIPRVHFDALEKLEKVLQEKEQFEQRIALEPLAQSNNESEEELEELCRIASDVPGLWHHVAVTHQERREILRCVIDHIVVATTKERIDATIVWKSGSRTPLNTGRYRGRHHLIRELYAQKLTALIKDHLAAGKTSTGQVVGISWRGFFWRYESWILKRTEFQQPLFHCGKKRRSFMERVGLARRLFGTS